jgi:hypothetical protein
MILDGVSIQKRYKESLRLLCLIKQSSVHGYSSDAESIVPTDCQEIALVVVQLEIVRRSLGVGIVVGNDIAQRFVVKNPRKQWKLEPGRALRTQR